MKRCVYAGSFDPLTNGHLWMIREGARLFDELIVAIGINPAKACTYSLEQRLDMLRASLADVPNVRISSFSLSFLADYARSASAQYILRGIRSESDYEYERGMRYVNEDLNPDLTTVFFIPPRSIVEVSSSMVKGLIGPIGWEHAIKKYVPEPVYSTILEHELAKRFACLWTSVSAQEPGRAFREIAARYSERHRQYHTLAHIAHCLSELDTVPLDPQTRQSVELAVWFHDVIHEGFSKANEQRSAEYFRELAEQAGIDRSVSNEVTAMILATERHQVPPDHDTEALRILLDIDLSILGAHRERFEAYDQAIRQEYAAVPDVVYYPERKRVLEQFLARDPIYLTPIFRERYERRARENLRAALTAQ